MISPAEAPIVDAHAHIFLQSMPVSPAAWHRPDYAFTAEQYLQVLDAHGVHFGVIAGISIFGLYNDYMLQELRKHQRLRGTVNVLPTTDRYVLERDEAGRRRRCAPAVDATQGVAGPGG